VKLLMPDHPDADRQGRVWEHRWVMERKLGRRLRPIEVVHHLNEDPSDNRPENLELYPTNAEHLRETLRGRTPKWTEDGKARMLQALQSGHRRWRATQQTNRPDPAGDDPAS